MYLEYYEKNVNLTHKEKRELLDLYVELYKEHNMGEPEVRRVDDLEDEALLTHVIYNIEAVGGEKIPEWLRERVGNKAENERNNLNRGTRKCTNRQLWAGIIQKHKKCFRTR